MSPHLPNFAEVRDEFDDTEDFYDCEQGLAQNLEATFKQTIILPDQSIQLPIIVAYTLMPSALAKISPILFFSGTKGSGKSTAMQIIGALHGQPILSAASSAVALRNHINQSRWVNAATNEGEKNTLLLFDNVTADSFKDDFLYLYFLNGYDRKTDMVMVSAGGGQNLTFRVFSPKVVSTIHSFLSDRQFEELARRCLVIRFKPLEQLTPDIHITPVDSLDLSILRAKYGEYWQDENNLKKYAAARRKLQQLRKKGKLSHGFSSSQWAISVDLLATGCCFDMWDAESGTGVLDLYWRWFETSGKPDLSPLQQLLKLVIDDELKAIDEVNEQYGEGTCDLEISATTIKKAVQNASQKGQLDTEPRAGVIADCMQTLGWCLKMNAAGKVLTWQPNN